MVKLVNATFEEIKIKKSSLEENPKYMEYRRKWEENPKNFIVGNFPIHIDIESTSACNLRCPMCFQSFNRPVYGFIKFELFKKIIDEGSEKGLCSIKLNIRGEPLMHPQLVDLIRYAKQKGIMEVMFNTNATLLTEEKARQLIEAGLDKLICSVDGYTKEFYESIRRGAVWETTLNNIKRFQEIKKELGVDKPIVRVQMVKLNRIKDPDHVKKYVEFWGKIADHIGMEDENQWDYTKNTGNIVCEDFKCPMLWQRLMIWFDGTIIYCCGDIYAENPAGNVNEKSLEEVWKDAKIKEMREFLKQGESYKIPICTKCGYRRTVIGKILEEKQENNLNRG